MSTSESPPSSAHPAAQLEGQTYEIIRNRLVQHGQELRERLARLNDARRDVFGSIETKLLATERITTSNFCQPRDMIAVADRLLFGYNVHIGLRQETVLEDVFAIYRYENHQFHEEPLNLINQDQFRTDFRELYKYYKNTRFARFARIGPYLFMVFRVGRQVADIKTFKWLIDGNRLQYLDNRSDHEYGFPPQHEFEWKRSNRDQHRAGLFPHVSIDDRVFVETVGGDLTIKIENNTNTGEGIYAEAVENPDQTLDDAEIYYAIVGNLILLKIRPYQEQNFRYILFNDKVQQAQRIDAVADACVLLPEGHGLIFSQGYYLQTGEYKTFDTALSDMVFQKKILSPNGEDYLYIFFNRLAGTHVLLSYNVITQVVSTPMICAGYAVFDCGEILTFRHVDEAQKHHAIQIWQTPYTSQEYELEKRKHLPSPEPGAEEDHLAPREVNARSIQSSYLMKIGNKDLVRGMAECHEVMNLIAKEDTYANLYLDISKLTTDILDAYFWIREPAAENLGEVLGGIRSAAQAAISEFDRVIRIRRNTEQELARIDKKTQSTFQHIRSARFDSIDDFVKTLSELRAVRGEIVSLRDLQYVHLETVDRLEKAVAESSDRLATSCVDFLIRPDALVSYEERVTKVEAQIEGVDKVTGAKALSEEIDDAASELEMLIEIVSNLKIDDATQRTTIIENISAIFARLNRIRAGLQNKMQSLASREGAAEFASQIKLLNQAVVNYLDICDAPEKCEEYLTKLMIQVEELEARFAEFDKMIDELGQKREEIYNAFEARRLQLVEAKNRRATTLMKSADRILKGIATRVMSLDSVDTIHGYFASDLMVDKVRDIIHQLTDLGDSVKVGDIQSRLKTIREDAVRQLKDRQDLYVDGQNIIQFGRHKFVVNTQSLDLTTVLRDGQMHFHLTGTNFFEPITNADFLATRDVWDQEIPSENRIVYRAEYLAYTLLRSNEHNGSTLFSPTAFPKAKKVAEQNPASYYFNIVQQFMAPRYAEGYIKGVHDHDGAILLQALVEMTTTIGLLRYGSRARTLAWLFWQTWDESVQKQIFAARLAGFGKITSIFPETTTQADCIAELQQLLGTWLVSFECPLENCGSSEPSPCLKPLGDEAGEYLFHALAGGETFVTSGDANRLCQRFREHLAKKAYENEFSNSLEKLTGSLTSQFRLACDWVTAFLDQTDADAHTRSLCDEVAQLLIEGDYDTSRIINASTVRDLEGLVGSHPRITDGRMRLSYNEFTTRLSEYQHRVVPAFQKYQALKYQLTDTRRAELKLDEFQPRVLTSFVRNRLIDQVYLPLIGDNQAKQIGTAGAETRTDRMGLLLLISPPGYGKTTLMEYVANRLGIIFMKVNGPAIGHRVTSLDPAEAPNAAAREEMEKLNLALEMGDNVMIYVDDIQHVSPEFLQKFISLCDATRKIEGVWNGRTRTYDLRGKKVSVVMAGNPYTESGTRFKIPDMLANRADTYNLGEIIGDNKIAFEMSYLENAMTSNPTLARVANRNPEDIYGLIHMAETDSKEPVDLAGNYSVDELGEMVKVLKKLIRVRDVVLAVNREYIRSAGQADEFRTEPPFQLQGSYRNMNRIAEHVSPVMNDPELNTLIFSQYEQDAQTLTTGAEANLLKFRELIGQLPGADAKRWDQIKRTFCQNQKLRGMDASDKVGQVIAQISTVADGLDAIRDAVVSGIEERAAAEDENAIQRDTAARQAAERLEGMGHQMDAFRTSLDAIHQTLASGLAKLEDVSTNIPAIPAPPYQIEVINRVPRVFLSIIREQFKLMQSWMQPLIKTTQENRQGLEELQKQLDAAMENYGKLVDQLEETE